MTPAALHAVAVTKHYRLGRQEIPVLRGIDLAVAAGESVALLGASGAGKSTLLHVLGLLDAPSGGEVRYDGRRVDDLPVRESAALRHRHVGFVFQFYHLIPELTALQNVLLAQI
ncbi:MAG: ATP-binding cassette domain-containing protein, partial [Planctomycetota bacterium]